MFSDFICDCCGFVMLLLLFVVVVSGKSELEKLFCVRFLALNGIFSTASETCKIVKRSTKARVKEIIKVEDM